MTAALKEPRPERRHRAHSISAQQRDSVAAYLDLIAKGPKADGCSSAKILLLPGNLAHGSC